MWYAILALCEEGDEVIYPNPGFPIYESVINFVGATPVPLKLREEKDFVFDIEDFKSKITEKTKMVILNSPQNPTGGVLGKEDILEIAKIAKQHSFFILTDEVYNKILYDGNQFHSIASDPELQDRIIILDGFSKSYAISVSMLLNGTAPINEDARIRNQGQINAINNVKLDSGKFFNNENSHGSIYTNAQFGPDFDTGDIVNLNTLDYVDNPEDLVLENGNIYISAIKKIQYLRGRIFAGNNIEILNLVNETDIYLRGITIYSGGNIKFLSDVIQLEDVDLQSENDIIINPERVLSIGESDYYSSNKKTIINCKHLTINSGSHGLRLFPDSINVESLESDFLFQNAPLNLQLETIYLGNLDNIFIGGQPLNTTSMNLEAYIISFYGNISTPGDIVANADYNINLDSNSMLQSDKNITLNAPNKLDIEYKAKIIAAENINITTDTLLMDWSSQLNATNDVKLIADDYIIDTVSPNTAITAGNNVIFSRQTAGNIEISNTGMLSPLEIDKVNCNIVIGNHADTNSLTENIYIKSNVYTDGDSIELSSTNNVQANRNIIISSRRLNNVWSDDHKNSVSIGNSGDITFNSSRISLYREPSVLAFTDNNFSFIFNI